MEKLAGHIKFKYRPIQDEIQQAQKFAEDVDATTNYGDSRNQKNASIRIHQCFIGKISEIAVVAYAKKMGYNIIEGVDWEIYGSDKKGWASDITLEKDGKKLKISIKSSPNTYGGITEYLDGEKIMAVLPSQYTYTIQLSDKHGNGGLDTGKHDRYILCNWIEALGIVDVYAWIEADTVKEMLIQPFSPSLKGIKGCIMKDTCGQSHGKPLREFPCGIDELIERQKENA